MPDPPPSAKRYLKKKKHLPNCHKYVETSEATENTADLETSAILPFERAITPPNQVQTSSEPEKPVKEERIYTFNNCKFNYLKPGEDSDRIPSDHDPGSPHHLQKDLTGLLETIRLMNQQGSKVELNDTVLDESFAPKMSISELSISESKGLSRESNKVNYLI